MKYLIQIISFVGILLVFSACESELPFPDAERVTLVTLDNMNDFPFLTSISDPNMDVKIGASLHKFGGTEYAKVEICVVRNPAANNYKTAVLAEITSGLSVSTPVVNTFKLSEIISKTGGGALASGEQFAFYYNLEMPDGTKSIGWSKATGYTGVHVDNIDGQRSSFRINVVCGIDFEDLLGEWLWSDPGGAEDEWTVMATEDPDKPGAGLIFTWIDEEGLENGEPAPDSPMKIGINMFNYTFSFPAQQFWSHMAFWGMPQYPLILDSASGELNTCTFTMSFTTYYSVNWQMNLGFGRYTITITKL